MDLCRIIGHHACATHETIPLTIRVAQVLGDAGIERLRLDRLQKVGLLRAPECACVCGNEHIGGAGRAFAGHPRDQLIGVALDAVDLDAGRSGELIVKREIAVVVTRGIQVHHPAVPIRRGSGRTVRGLATGNQRQHRTGRHNHSCPHLDLPASLLRSHNENSSQQLASTSAGCDKSEKRRPARVSALSYA